MTAVFCHGTSSFMEHCPVPIEVDADFRLPLALVASVPARVYAIQPAVRTRAGAVFLAGLDRLGRCSPDLRELQWVRPCVGVSALTACGDVLFVIRSTESGEGRLAVVDTATGDERLEVCIPGDASIAAITADARYILLASRKSAASLCLDAASWTSPMAVPSLGFYVEMPLMTAAIGLADAFAVAPADTGTLLCLEAASGRVRWEVALPGEATQTRSEQACRHLALVKTGLLCRTGFGAMLHLVERDGRILARRDRGGPQHALVVGRRVFEFDHGRQMTVLDATSLDQLVRLDWSADRPAGNVRALDQFAVSRRSVVWTAGGQLQGAYWPGRRGGRRRVWTSAEVPYANGVSVVGDYVYAVSRYSPVGMQLYCLTSADRIGANLSAWSRPWRRAEERRRRWLAHGG